jgi:hypothetical protein
MYSGQSFSFLDFIEDKDAFLASEWQLESKKFNKMYMVLFSFPVIRRYIYRNIVDTVDLNKYAGILDIQLDDINDMEHDISCNYVRYSIIRYHPRLSYKQKCIDYYFEWHQTGTDYTIICNDNVFYILFFISDNEFGIFDLKSYDICRFHISMLTDIIPYSFDMCIVQIIQHFKVYQ